ncbi:MAG: MBL fold metallo-hydrolase [Bdellovibrionota bacterium]
MYVHLVRGSPGPLTLFDAGLPHPMTQQALRDELAVLGLTVRNLEQIVYTHSHIDHMGGGFIISGETDWPRHLAFHGCVGLCENFEDYNRKTSSWKTLISHLNYVPAFRDRIGQFIPMDNAAREKVFQGALSETAEVAYHDFAPGGAPIRFARGLREGDQVEAGPYRWKVVEAPGHNPHHVAFLEEEGRVSVTGDLILDHGTPIMRSMGDDVALYLVSLARLAGDSLGIVLPSHGPLFLQGDAALDRIRTQRETLLDWVWHALAGRSQRLVDLSMAALSAGAAGAKANPILLLGVLESALHGWCERGIASFDEKSGFFGITTGVATSRRQDAGAAA